jgi:hypothetical protein
LVVRAALQTPQARLQSGFSQDLTKDVSSGSNVGFLTSAPATNCIGAQVFLEKWNISSSYFFAPLAIHPLATPSPPCCPTAALWLMTGKAPASIVSTHLKQIGRTPCARHL